ncbi:hypothetical protein EMIHUDRAFT_233138 [Emiliania huxleyi CCMP1516]|uniref:Uncharacterized protein n=2 Tax=Emiliania huxleyi TaxID=2903 RepID=A0A0D3K3F8_EMIH1|nr:hypothetical protein EMIHUDRAFT_233138 [Emiliania huxleyi CCMP1516]EOD30293.1 hypothetical protein EMIHUDRAFT_233138 [Emiliania huxleyi CCMP1516]|eukprot:XP_005782722.1 hypothetical protein EMIHUDRAFT_233138 [Emiliania huxleyi CCMP1516]
MEQIDSFGAAGGSEALSRPHQAGGLFVVQPALQVQGYQAAEPSPILGGAPTRNATGGGGSRKAKGGKGGPGALRLGVSEEEEKRRALVHEAERAARERADRAAQELLQEEQRVKQEGGSFVHEARVEAHALTASEAGEEDALPMQKPPPSPPKPHDRGDGKASAAESAADASWEVVGKSRRKGRNKPAVDEDAPPGSSGSSDSGRGDAPGRGGGGLRRAWSADPLGASQRAASAKGASAPSATASAPSQEALAATERHPPPASEAGSSSSGFCGSECDSKSEAGSSSSSATGAGTAFGENTAAHIDAFDGRVDRARARVGGGAEGCARR